MHALLNLPHTNINYNEFKSPVGNLTLLTNEQFLIAVLWDHDAEALSQTRQAWSKGKRHLVLSASRDQLNEYFEGRRKNFNLPILFEGTSFQKKVWGELLKIPYGQTISYGMQARAIGSPKSYRAVGAANGRNPISIIVPCHRVISSSGQLSGFGGGVQAKQTLLDLERFYSAKT